LLITTVADTVSIATTRRNRFTSAIDDADNKSRLPEQLVGVAFPAIRPMRSSCRLFSLTMQVAFPDSTAAAFDVAGPLAVMQAAHSMRVVISPTAPTTEQHKFTCGAIEDHRPEAVANEVAADLTEAVGCFVVDGGKQDESAGIGLGRGR
jgi:hypothetical protein